MNKKILFSIVLAVCLLFVDKIKVVFAEGQPCCDSGFRYCALSGGGYGCTSSSLCTTGTVLDGSYACLPQPQEFCFANITNPRGTCSTSASPTLTPVPTATPTLIPTPTPTTSPTCVLTLTSSPATPNTPETMELTGAIPNEVYSVIILSVITSCTYPDQITTRADGTQTIPFNCTGSGSRQFETTSLGGASVCQITFDVGTIAPQTCTALGRSGVCYPFPDTVANCRPPSVFGGVGTCTQSGTQCCIPGVPAPGACTGNTTGLPGHCYFLVCPIDRPWDGMTIPANAPTYFPLPPMTVQGCHDFESCCLDATPTMIPKPEIPVGCVTSGRNGINTAVGCIPVDTLSPFLVFILPWTIGVGGGVALILIVIAGFLIIASQGNKERVQAGKELLTAAVIGLLLLIFSVFLLDLIGIRILRVPGL